MIRQASIITLLCALCSLAACIVFKDCTTYLTADLKLANFTKVSVTGCKVSDERCPLVCGTNSTISIQFRSFTCVEYLSTTTFTKKENIHFPIINPSVCRNPDSGLHCPLCVDNDYSFNSTMHVQVPKDLPTDYADVDLQWHFTDNYAREILCIEFAGRLIRDNNYKIN